jgi:RimJ/RimL family protein N-acetyltransferase
MKQSLNNHSYKGDVMLRDGSTVHIRPITQGDEKPLLEFFRSLSSESKWLRFFSIVQDSFLVCEAHREAAVDNIKTGGLIAISPDGKRIIGHAIYSQLASAHAEAAFAVADDYQGLGLGTILLIKLAQAAAAKNIEIFEAEVMGANHQMIGVFRNSGFKITTKIQHGQCHIEFPISFRESVQVLKNFPQ